MTASTPLHRRLYVQVLAAIVVGAVLGWLSPSMATHPGVQALGEGFVKLIKMLVAPIIFCTVVSGVAHVRDAQKVGRVGFRALVYFEIVSTLALAIGLVVGNVVGPGRGFNAVAPSAPNAAKVADFATKAHDLSTIQFLVDIIPESAVGAFTEKGSILQVLLLAILFGFALMGMGERGDTLRKVIDELSHAIFRVIGIVMKAAPVGAFGAMAFTVGKYGPAVLGKLLGLVATFYVTSFLFVVVVLGLIARLCGFSLLRFLAYLKDEIFLVVGTSSSESALAPLMDKLERLGCGKSVVRLVVPTGYSFNLDGTNIYMTLATLFVAQSLGMELTISQQVATLGVAMISSKGASGVSGAGFVTLAATLSVVNPALVPGMAVLLGIDKFMSECRAVTNFCGNGVAAIVVSAWERELDRDKLAQTLAR